jgi:restriction endonuclease S subunit
MTSINEDGTIDVTGSVRIPADQPSNPRYSLCVGDVLFGNTNSAELVGRAGVFKGHSEEVTFSNHLTRLRLDQSRLLPEWLVGYLLFLWRKGAMKSVTTRFVGQSCIPTAALLNIPIGAPNLSHQKRDIRLLDSIDTTIETTRRIIAQTQRLKSAIAQDLLFMAVRDGRLVARSTRLGELFTERVEKGIPGLPTIAVTMNDGIMDRDDLDRRIESALTPQEHLLAHNGDIAYNMMRMWQGVSGLVPHDALVSPAYVVATPGPDIHPPFAAHLFKLPETIRLLRRYSQGITDDRLRLYYHQFAQIPITIPARLEDQHRIAQLIDTLDQTAAAQQSTLTALTRTKTAIANEIFSTHS